MQQRLKNAEIATIASEVPLLAHSLCAHSPKGLESFIKITETSFGPGSDPELPGVIIPEQTHIQNKVKTQTRKPAGAGGAR